MTRKLRIGPWGLIGPLMLTTTLARGDAVVFPPGPPAPVPSVPFQFDIIGHIEAISLDKQHDICTPGDDRLAGGTVTVNGVTITVPCNTVLQLPATALTFAELFDRSLVAPMTPWGNSGLALSEPGVDMALPPGYELRVQGNIVNGRYVAGLMFVSQQLANVGQGVIQAIDYQTGELCIGNQIMLPGAPCVAPNARVRLNDPVGRFGLRHGVASGPMVDVVEPNYDPRFTVDTDNPTVRSSTGYPMCIPRQNPFATGDDPLCPQGNRPIAPNCKNLPSPFAAFSPQSGGQYCRNFMMDPLPVMPASACFKLPCPTDPSRQAPFEVGDYVDYAGTLTLDSPTTLGFGALTGDPHPYYISAHTLVAHVGIYTTPGTRPVYVAIDELEAGTSGLPVLNIAQEATARFRVEGVTTDPSALVDIYAMDVQYQTGAVKDRLLGTVSPAGPPVVGRVRYRPAAGVFAPLTRNYRIVSRSMCGTSSGACKPPPVPATFANGLVAGQYNAPNFEYIFPENLVPGDPTVPANFQDVPFLFCGSGPLTTATVTPGTVGPSVGPLQPAPWLLQTETGPMSVPVACDDIINPVNFSVTRPPVDTLTITTTQWDNSAGLGRLTVVATSSLSSSYSGLQLHLRAVNAQGVPLTLEAQPMTLITSSLQPGICPTGVSRCWRYVANGTINDGGTYTAPTSVTVVSTYGGSDTATGARVVLP